jgi:hypothetical protein
MRFNWRDEDHWAAIACLGLIVSVPIGIGTSLSGAIKAARDAERVRVESVRALMRECRDSGRVPIVDYDANGRLQKMVRCD